MSQTTSLSSCRSPPNPPSSRWWGQSRTARPGAPGGQRALWILLSPLRGPLLTQCTLVTCAPPEDGPLGTNLL